MAIMDGKAPPRRDESILPGLFTIALLIIGGWAIYHYHWWHALNAWLGWKGWAIVIGILVLIALLRFLKPIIGIIFFVALVIGLTYLSYILFRHDHWIWGLVCLTPWAIFAFGIKRFGGQEDGDETTKDADEDINKKEESSDPTG